MTSSRGGTLFVVATPIGNLGDITLRALETLRSVPLIAAEDTRVTRRLLTRYEIPTRTTSYHARSGPVREEELLTHLRGGADLALVTDAGTPAVSDPGEGLVARWAFEGFLPRSGRERRERLARIAADERGNVVFEAPGRTAATLRDLAAACGGGRVGAVCRELTKLHETITRDTLASLAEAAADGAIPARGEVVIVVGWAAASGDRGAATAGAVEVARAEVERLVASGIARGEAAKRVAREHGIPRRQLYGEPRD